MTKSPSKPDNRILYSFNGSSFYATIFKVLLLALLMLGASHEIATAQNSAYITNGLMVWWKCNDAGGTTAADSTGSGINLPLINSPSWGPNYLTLNGTSQYGDAGSNRLTSLDQHDKTICAWINKNSSSFKGIVDKDYVDDGVGYGGWGFWVLSNNHLDWWVEVNQDLQDDGAASVTVGQWTFVAVVWHYTIQQADFYINGVLNSSVNNGAAVEFPSKTADLEVGNLRNNLSGGAYAFDGSMRDVGIYDRALSAAEVKSNYLGSELSTNVSVPDLLYYQMTEHTQSNSPIFLADSSTHGGTTGAIFVAPPSKLQWVTNGAAIPATAVHFNGVSTYIDTSNSMLFNFTTNQFTINFWVCPLTANGYLMENGNYQMNGWYVSVGGTYQIYFGTETNGIDTAISTGPGAAQVGEYTMVTIVRTGPTNALIYLNGIQAPTTGSITIPAPSTNSLIFGVDRARAHYLDGNMWLPQIWGEALPATAIANLYFSQSSGYPWPLPAAQIQASPLLSIKYSANRVIVSWPASLTGWTLQTNGNLSSSNWGNYAGTIINNTVTNSPQAGNLFFRLVHSSQAPLLTLTYSANQAIISWPLSFTGWTLQTNGNLSPGNWMNYGGTIINNTVTNSRPTGNLFFRLTHP